MLKCGACLLAYSTSPHSFIHNSHLSMYASVSTILKASQLDAGLDRMEGTHIHTYLVNGRRREAGQPASQPPGRHGGSINRTLFRAASHCLALPERHQACGLSGMDTKFPASPALRHLTSDGLQTDRQTDCLALVPGPDILMQGFLKMEKKSKVRA